MGFGMPFKKRTSDEEVRVRKYTVEGLRIEDGRVVGEVGNTKITIDESNMVRISSISERGFVKKERVEWEAHCNSNGFIFSTGGLNHFSVQVHARDDGLYFRVAPHSQSWQFHRMMAPGGSGDDFLSLEGVMQAFQLYNKDELIELKKWGAVRLKNIEEIARYHREIREAAKIVDGLKDLPEHPKVVNLMAMGKVKRLE